MINIRPHHLLCMHGFVGKGYDAGFTENMARLVGLIQRNGNTKLNIILNTDDICMKCPHKAGENLCARQEKVARLDDGTVKTLGIRAEVYSYHEIAARIKANLSEDGFDEICHECEWHASGDCRKGLFHH